MEIPASLLGEIQANSFFARNNIQPLSPFNSINSLYLLKSFLSLLGLDAQRSVRNSTETACGDELARLAADAIRLVLDTHESCLQALDKLHLTLGQTHGLLLGERVGTLFQNLIGRSRVVVRIIVTIAQRALQVVVVALGQF